jgi:uncharacterized protein YqhQ
VSAESTGPAIDPAELAPHHYGGQAVLEGVMMRGRDRWAVAVRRPTGDIWLECHPVSDAPWRRRWLRLPLVRGCYALIDSLSIGTRALRIAAERSLEGDDADDAGGAAVGASLLLAVVLFVGVFIVLPSAATKGLDTLLGGPFGDGVLFHTLESLVRIAVFLGYLWAISRLPEIRRVFRYHGAEHRTIAAWEHDEVLEPDAVQRYSTVHVRCGTNFLILVMLLALVVYTVGGVLVPPPPDAGAFTAVLYHVALRVVLLPVVAGLAYEGLRLGAARGDRPLVRVLMRPGLWLQRITTAPPTTDQVEVAIRAFEAVAPPAHLAGRVARHLPSAVTLARTGLPVALAHASTRQDGDPWPADDRPADDPPRTR